MAVFISVDFCSKSRFHGFKVGEKWASVFVKVLPNWGWPIPPMIGGEVVVAGRPQAIRRISYEPQGHVTVHVSPMFNPDAAPEVDGMLAEGFEPVFGELG